LEAAPAIQSLVNALNLAVLDPQGAMVNERFDSDTLIKTWNEGNTAATREMRTSSTEEHFDLPTATLTRAWQWNLNRAQLQRTVGESVFVPLVMFASIEGATVTSAVWPDAIPAMLPKVDHLCMSRKELAPRKLFRKEPDITFVSWTETEALLLKYGSADEQGTITLRYATAPKDIAAFVRKLPEEMRTTLRIFPDRVLDREIVQDSRD